MKINNSVVTIALAICITSCGSNSSFEKDMTKMAELSCKFSKTMDKSIKLVKEATVKDSSYFQSYRAIENEMAALKKEGEVLKSEIEKKYPKFEENTSKKKLAEKILKETMEKCK